MLIRLDKYSYSRLILLVFVAGENKLNVLSKKKKNPMLGKLKCS